MIEIRLRVPLHLKTHDQRMMEAITGREFPATVIPARTTLTVVDIFTNGALALDPKGQRVLVSPETCRAHSYEPRRHA